MTQYKKLISYILLLVLVIASIWLIYNINQHSKKQTSIDNQGPSTIVDQIVATRFDAKGHIKSQLISPQLIHYTKNNSSNFLTPHITVYSPGKKPWVITAKYAYATDGSNKIILKDNVRLHQAAGKDNQASTITTSELTLYSKTQIATTKAPVTVVQIAKDNSKNIIKSIGVTANQKTGVIHFLSHTRGYYEPAK